MKTTLVLLAALIGNVYATQTRVFFFVKSSDGGASFRLQCVQNPPANRCPISVFKKTADDLCEKNQMALKELGPISCLNEEEDRACKYTNGKCAPAPKTEKEKEALEKKVEETSQKKLPSTDELQKVDDLPNEVPNESLKPLKNVEELEEVRPLPEELPDL